MNGKAGQSTSRTSSSQQQHQLRLATSTSTSTSTSPSTSTSTSNNSETSIWVPSNGLSANNHSNATQHQGCDAGPAAAAQTNKRPATDMDEDSQSIRSNSMSPLNDHNEEQLLSFRANSRPPPSTTSESNSRVLLLQTRRFSPNEHESAPSCKMQLGIQTNDNNDDDTQLGGHASNASNTSDSEQQRRYRPQKYCAVCGDKAIACNFNAVTCESCKAFFRRNAFKEQRLRCLFENRCIIDRVTRRFCSKCRLLKCFNIGMKREWILTDEQKQIKRVKIMQNKQTRQQQQQLNEIVVTTPSSAAHLASEIQSITPVSSFELATPTAASLTKSHQLELEIKPKLMAGHLATKCDVATSCPDEADLMSGHLLHYCSMAHHCQFCSLRLSQQAAQQPYQAQHSHHHHHQQHFAHNHHYHSHQPQQQQEAPTQTQLHQHQHPTAHYQAANSSFYHHAASASHHHPIYQQQQQQAQCHIQQAQQPAYVQTIGQTHQLAASPPSTTLQSPASTGSTATTPVPPNCLNSSASLSPSSSHKMMHHPDASLINYHHHYHAHHHRQLQQQASQLMVAAATTTANATTTQPTVNKLLQGQVCCCSNDPTKPQAGNFHHLSCPQSLAPATLGCRATQEEGLLFASPARSSAAAAAPHLHLMEPLHHRMATSGCTFLELQQKDTNDRATRKRLSSSSSSSTSSTPLAYDCKRQGPVPPTASTLVDRELSLASCDDAEIAAKDNTALEKEEREADKDQDDELVGDTSTTGKCDVQTTAHNNQRQESISQASQTQDCQRPSDNGGTSPPPSWPTLLPVGPRTSPPSPGTAFTSSTTSAAPTTSTPAHANGSGEGEGSAYVSWQNELFIEPATTELEVMARVERLDFSDTERQLIDEMILATRTVFEPNERLQNDSALDDIVFFCDEALRRLIKTVKQISAFRMLSMDDQVILLKNACFKILLLRSSLHYQDDVEGWRDKSGRIMALKALRTTKCNNYELHKEIMEKLAVPLRLDRLVMAFLIMVILFDPTANLKHSNSVGLDNLVYLCTLRKYLTGFQPDPLAKYERIVEALQVVNACNEEYNLFFSKNYQPEQITPLLIEIFDISITDSM